MKTESLVKWRVSVAGDCPSVASQAEGRRFESGRPLLGNRKPGRDVEPCRALRWVFSRSFCRFDHERGQLNPTDGRRPQFFEDLIGGGAPEHPLVPLLRIMVGRHSTAYYELLITCQVHARNLTGLSAAGTATL